MELSESYQVSQEESHRERSPTNEPIDREVNYVDQESVGRQRNNKKTGKPTVDLVLWEGYPNKDRTYKIYDKLKKPAEEALLEFLGRNQNAD